MDVLVVERDPHDRQTLEHILRSLGYRVDAYAQVEEIEDSFEKWSPRVAFVGMNGDREATLRLVSRVQRSPNPFPVIVLTREPAFEDAVRTMKAGAHDFWICPVSKDKVQRVMEWLETDRKPRLRLQPDSHVTIITRDDSMLKVKALASRVAMSQATVFIQGESGTGKELFARFIHESSRRRRKPFLAVNCAALPENLLESELFGYEKGAFTGATRRRKGKFELAHGGTLLLDEVTEIPITLQAKLLRVLQEREVDPLGAQHSIPVDVRIVATTNVDLVQAVKEGRFRKDLYYRLSVIPLVIPPLRQRLDDIPLLCEHFIAKYNPIHQTKIQGISPKAVRKLQSHRWPGNVRELENVMQRAMLLAHSPILQPDDIVFDAIDEGLSTHGELMSIAEMERRLIMKALESVDGNRTRAAEILGISVRTLRNKLNEYKKNPETSLPRVSSTY